MTEQLLRLAHERRQLFQVAVPGLGAIWVRIDEIYADLVILRPAVGQATAFAIHMHPKAVVILA